MRYVEFLRDDVWFRVAVSNDTLGAMTEMIDGVPRPAPAFESNQIDASLLPFLGETSSPNVAFFPWDEMEIMEWSSSWIIGSRGLPGERPYSDPAEFMLEEPDGPKRSLLPAAAAVEDNRRRLAQFLATQEAR
jgi:hypothetical protein